MLEAWLMAQPGPVGVPAVVSRPCEERRRARARVARATLLGVALGAAALAAGCAPVKPHQRGIHSKAIMQTDPDPQERELDAHTQQIREGSTGDPTLSGGGCGCN